MTRSDWWALAIFLAIFFVWIPCDILLQRSLAPPAGVTTLAGFASTMRAPKEVYIVTVEGRNHIIWIGETAPLPAMSSGPACYLFDSSGHLVDWTTELGEGHRLDQIVGQGREITLPDAMALIEHMN